jgi:hypothetical protein
MRPKVYSLGYFNGVCPMGWASTPTMQRLRGPEGYEQVTGKSFGELFAGALAS